MQIYRFTASQGHHSLANRIVARTLQHREQVPRVIGTTFPTLWSLHSLIFLTPAAHQCSNISPPDFASTTIGFYLSEKTHRKKRKDLNSYQQERLITFIAQAARITVGVLIEWLYQFVRVSFKPIKRHRGIEPPSSRWKRNIITIIRMPHDVGDGQDYCHFSDCSSNHLLPHFVTDTLDTVLERRSNISSRQTTTNIGTSDEIRTHTITVLSRVSLPIGVQRYLSDANGIRTRNLHLEKVMS